MNMVWVTLQVSSLDESLAFYNGKLGLPVSRKIEREDVKIVFLGEEADAKVELIWRGGGKVEDAGKGISVGFMVEELEALLERLAGTVSEIEGPFSPNPGMSYYRVKDPDGYTVQLCTQK